MPALRNIALATILSAVLSLPVWARSVPERELPVPETVSPRLQKAMAAGLADWWNIKPENSEEWEKFRNERDRNTLAIIPGLLKTFEVKSQPGEIAGIPVYTLTPENMPDNHKDKVLLLLHGGGYLLGAGEAGTHEGLYMAGIGKFRVVCVDYRMPPEFPYPAALDDALAVYRALLKKYPAQNIGVFGSSTGGGITLALVLRAKAEGLPVPGAIAAGTPWCDLTKTGDSYYTNENVDSVLVSYDGWLDSAAKAYANGHDLKDPFISPVYGDLAGFPPTIMGTGTRDLFLSNTARMHRKLREAGVPADLLVIEGASHAEYFLLGPDAPESIYYFRQLTRFFDKYLK